MLGPQGARVEQLESDPNKVESFEPEPTLGMNWLFVVLTLAFAALAFWLALRPDTALLTRWFVLVGGAFFLWAAFGQARRANKRRAVRFDSTGLWVDGPSSRKLIHWANIDQTSIWSVRSQQFNVISLKNVADLVSQYSPAEAKDIVREEGVAAALAAAMFIRSGKSELGGLEGVFAKRRDFYGGEIYISSPDRDRDALAFDHLINAWRLKYAGEETQ